MRHRLGKAVLGRVPAQSGEPQRLDRDVALFWRPVGTTIGCLELGMPKHNRSRRPPFNGSDAVKEIRKPKHRHRRADVGRKVWVEKLRPRDSLVTRGQATALGIHLVKNQLRAINASLKEQLLTTSPPVGFGDLSAPLTRADEMMNCLFELREMINTLQFHMDVDAVATLPVYVPVTQPVAQSGPGRAAGYHALLNERDQRVGKIALIGLVNRYSSAVFSDHHGLLLRAHIDDHPPLHIYYQSFDATSQFSGSTAVRSTGSMLPFTRPSGHDTSLRGAVGFAEQLSRLMLLHPQINVIILAEAGGQDAARLLRGSVGPGWTYTTNNATGASGVNDITMFYKSSLKDHYAFSVGTSGLGNTAQIRCGAAGSACTLLGCHILNSKAKNKTVGEFMAANKSSAIFGDTNMSTTGSSLGFGFATIESRTSVTDSLTFDFSNSASNKMFDKLLVRTRFRPK